MEFEVVEIPSHILEELAYLESNDNSFCFPKFISSKKTFDKKIKKQRAFSNLADLFAKNTHPLYDQNEYTNYYITFNHKKSNTNNTSNSKKWIHFCPL